ncbi:MAG: hypothetical protein K9J17_16780 [Flavobacteriales bacterium]|nr:hypothetical protein [Flavobacteriales bacterium]
MKHLKTTLLTFALLFSVNTLMAQEKYDYAVVNYDASSQSIFVSINGESFEQIKVSKDETKEKFLDLSPVLRQLNKMNDEGWEVYSTQVPANTAWHMYQLKRKEQ